MSKKKHKESISEDTHEEKYDRYEDILPETDNKRWELDPNTDILELRNELRKRLNNKGVEEVTSWIRMALGKNVALSNLDANEISKIVVNEVRSFNREIVAKRKEWGCGKKDMEPISRWIERSIFFQLKRAYNDGERKYRSESYGYRENYNHDEVRADEIGSGGGRGLSWYNPFSGNKEKREVQYEDGFN